MHNIIETAFRWGEGGPGVLDELLPPLPTPYIFGKLHSLLHVSVDGNHFNPINFMLNVPEMI